jgi:hypothetical protein
MPANKDFKRLIRVRMRKTGEAYTTARARLLRNSPSPKTAPRSAPLDYDKLAGMSDASIKAATGCTWQRWVGALDYVNAYEWPHREIAEYVQKEFNVRDWWTQAVVVGYERIKGIRAIGQRRDGTFEATKSKVFAVPLTRLYRAWADPRTRRQWLPDVKLAVKSATRGKTMRITWPDRTPLEVYFIAKGRNKAQVALAHRKLPSKAAATEMKAFWTDRLAILGRMLAP